ncbi:MAG: translation elongation factor Ts [Phycisphaeraceae bacterium]|nr:translation elongation factor Ts [Phycisphaeraceae bacterium]
MAITATDVKDLRDKTGLGMMECKKALTETDGNVEEAVDLLRQKGLAKMDDRSDRAAAEGRIATAVSDDKHRGVIVEVNTETDFTAGNDEFAAMMEKVADSALTQDPGQVEKTDEIQAAIDEVRLTTKENAQFARGEVLGGDDSYVGSYVHFTGKVGVLLQLTGEVDDQLMTDLCMHVAAISPAPLGVTQDDIDDAMVEREREIARQQAIDEGKPEQIVDKIVEGKIRKFYEERALLEQGFIKDDKQQVKDLLPEGVTIKNYVRYALGEGDEAADEG